MVNWIVAITLTLFLVPVQMLSLLVLALAAPSEPRCIGD